MERAVGLGTGRRAVSLVRRGRDFNASKGVVLHPMLAFPLRLFGVLRFNPMAGWAGLRDEQGHDAQGRQEGHEEHALTATWMRHCRGVESEEAEGRSAVQGTHIRPGNNVLGKFARRVRL